MPKPVLVLSIQSSSAVVQFYFRGESVTAHAISKEGIAELPQPYPVDKDVLLHEGACLVMGEQNLGVGCKVRFGDVVIIQPTGGEDPWPDPTGAPEVVRAKIAELLKQ